jgi:hypothetical protein
MTTDLSRDIAHLRQLIDDGDDTALPILADAMEEAGDPRADGLRLVGDRKPLVTGWATWYHDANGNDGVSALPYRRVWLRIETRRAAYVSDSCISFRSRSIAYLALAEALVTEPAHA